MYVIERRIEELESQLIKLNSLRDDIESQKQDAIDMTVDTLRMVCLLYTSPSPRDS